MSAYPDSFSLLRAHGPEPGLSLIRLVELGDFPQVWHFCQSTKPGIPVLMAALQVAQYNTAQDLKLVEYLASQIPRSLPGPRELSIGLADRLWAALDLGDWASWGSVEFSLLIRQSPEYPKAELQEILYRLIQNNATEVARAFLTHPLVHPEYQKDYHWRFRSWIQARYNREMFDTLTQGQKGCPKFLAADMLIAALDDIVNNRHPVIKGRKCACLEDDLSTQVKLGGKRICLRCLDPTKDFLCLSGVFSSYHTSNKEPITRPLTFLLVAGYSDHLDQIIAAYNRSFQTPEGSSEDSKEEIITEYHDLFIMCAGLGRLSIVKFLYYKLFQSLSPDTQQRMIVRQAMEYAANNGQSEVMDFLFAEVDNNSFFGDHPLYWAVHEGHLKVVEDLRQRGFNLRTRGDLLLRLAIINDHYRLVKYLVTQGLSLADSNYLPIRLAAEYHRPKILMYLVFGMTPPRDPEFVGLSQEDCLQRYQDLKHQYQYLLDELTRLRTERTQPEEAEAEEEEEKTEEGDQLRETDVIHQPDLYLQSSAPGFLG
jgi:hypothetical protein